MIYDVPPGRGRIFTNGHVQEICLPKDKEIIREIRTKGEEVVGNPWRSPADNLKEVPDEVRNMRKLASNASKESDDGVRPQKQRTVTQEKVHLDAARSLFRNTVLSQVEPA
uniref:Uncharacterized protein n=1 Tax=viral metagenome TaxID=1070528 RepID=A0A6M3L0F4_9ZZZZ